MSVQAIFPSDFALPNDISILWGIQVLSVVGVVVAIVKQFFGPSKLGAALPTPGGLPWAGPVWAVEAANIYKTFKSWSDKFGPLYEVKLFGQNLIIISDPQIAKEVLAQKAKFASDRPPLALVEGSKDSGKYLPFLGNNEHLTKQRRFGVQINNYTHQANYHGRMLPEAVRFVHKLLIKQDDPFVLVDRLCSRLSARMAFGTPAPGPAIARSAHNFMQNLSPGGRITNVLTFLRHLPAALHSEVHNEVMRVDIEDRVWVGCYEKAKAAYSDGTLKASYAKYYFDNQAHCGLLEQEAMHGIAMMATVSILTIIAPLQRWLIVMAAHPEWQTTVQKELDLFFRREGRMVDVNDSDKVPVLRATILESMRWASPVPTGIPHRLEADMEYNGYHLAKDSNVLACDWAICRSDVRYPNSNTFDPARYLDSTSNTPTPKIQGHTVFGYGRRVCIGQDYAAAQLLVVCAAVAQFLDIGLPTDSATGLPISADSCLERATGNVIPILESVDLTFTRRSEEGAELLRTVYEAQRITGEREDEECL